MPLYRCAADRLRVSLADAPIESHEAMFEEVDAGWLPATRHALGRAVGRQAAWLDLDITLRGPAGLASVLVPSGRPGAPADDFLYYRGWLWLDAAEREHLVAVPEPGKR